MTLLLWITVTPALTVTQVVPTLAGGRAGLRLGDALLSIDGISVGRADDARRALDRYLAHSSLRAWTRFEAGGAEVCTG